MYLKGFEIKVLRHNNSLNFCIFSDNGWVQTYESDFKSTFEENHYLSLSLSELVSMIQGQSEEFMVYDNYEYKRLIGKSYTSEKFLKYLFKGYNDIYFKNYIYKLLINEIHNS